jgi:hypothetical protein
MTSAVFIGGCFLNVGAKNGKGGVSANTLHLVVAIMVAGSLIAIILALGFLGLILK